MKLMLEGTEEFGFAIRGTTPGPPICDHVRDLATAREIVHVVNTHAALVEALETLIEDVMARQREHACPGFDCAVCTPDFTAARAALAQARGE